MKRLLNKLIGTDDNYSFEERLYLGICCIEAVGEVIVTVINIIDKLYIDAVITTLLAVNTIILYYIARFKGRYFFFGLYVLTTLLLVISYFKGLGIHGNLPIYMLVVLVLTLVYTKTKRYISVFIFQLIVLCIIFFIEYHFPQLIINPYKTPNVLHNGLVSAMIVAVTFICFGIYFLRKNYDAEKEKNQEQKAVLETINKQKSLFFVNLSHEIRTPLTLVENYLDSYIADKGLDERLSVIQQYIQKMRHNILDYLEFENLERGVISYGNMEVFLLNTFMEEIINLAGDYAKKMKNIALNYTIEPEIYVKTTVKGIEQVLNNLLGNAVKYTLENNAIHIDIKKTGNGAQISVQNNGVVIPAKQLLHLFEPFYQLSDEKQNVQGIGMGLYIVKRILDSTGGKIEVISNKDIGAVFTVTIPTGTKDEVTLQAATGTGAPILNAIIPKVRDTPYSVDKPCLLVVEDNNELLKYLVNELQTEYNVFVADNGLMALDRLEHIPCPELIISDIMMDKLDGNELLEKTLANEKFAHIPFIFLTAKSTIADKISGLDSGAVDFITKPFSIYELKPKVKAIIAQKTRLSDAIVRDQKKQFTDTHHAAIKKKNDEIFTLNAVKYHLTAREIDIVSCLCEGLTYEKIASKLHISENTVSRHVQNIYRKTACSSRLALINKMYS